MKNTVLLKCTLASAFILCFSNHESWAASRPDIEQRQARRPVNGNPPVVPVVSEDEAALEKARKAADRAKKRWGIKKGKKSLHNK